MGGSCCKGWIFALALAAAQAWPIAPPAAGEIAGAAQAKDGDSLLIGGREVRLNGIDAPEWSAVSKRWRQRCTDAHGKSWACGAEARGLLDSLVAGRAVRCAETGYSSYRRPVVTCFVDGRDLSEIMARAGFHAPRADWPGPYDAAAAEARVAGRGIWRGAFTPPWEWRAQQRGKGR